MLNQNRGYVDSNLTCYEMLRIEGMMLYLVNRTDREIIPKANLSRSGWQISSKGGIK